MEINFEDILAAVDGLTEEQKQQFRNEFNKQNSFDCKAYLAELKAQQTDEAKAQAELKARLV